MISPASASSMYPSLPTEQRLKTLAELTQKAAENTKKQPVYLQMELAKSTAGTLRVSIMA